MQGHPAQQKQNLVKGKKRERGGREVAKLELKATVSEEPHFNTSQGTDADPSSSLYRKTN